MKEDPALTFALTLKRWFAANDWPQLITDSWAKDEGIQNPHGPWASQMCGAMKGAGYNPKAEFFLALAEFNRFVAEQDLTRIKGSKLRDRLFGAKAICTEDGKPYGGAEFWSLFAGLLEPPKIYSRPSVKLTQEDVDEWVAIQRDNFRQISLTHMCSRAEAWIMLKEKLTEYDCCPDDIAYLQEVLSGLHQPTVEESIRRAQVNDAKKPLTKAFSAVLGDGVIKQATTERLHMKALSSESTPHSIIQNAMGMPPAFHPVE